MHALEELLFDLQKKIQLAAHKIETLKAENADLRDQIAILKDDQAIHSAETDVLKQHLTELEEKLSQSLAVDVGERISYLSPDEREALERQIDALIARIDTHLG